MSKEYYKVVMLGEGRVGKTSLTSRFVVGKFDKDEKSTVNASYLEKIVEVGNGN
jgi:Ras-related protein Rab-21